MATAEEYAGWIVANADKRGTPEFNTVAQAYNLAKTGMAPRPRAPIETPQFEKDAAAIANATPAEVIAGNPVMRGAIGAADMVRGAGQLFSNMVGRGEAANTNESSLQSIIDAGRKAYGSDGFDWSRLAGGVLSPVGLGIAKVMGPAATGMGRVMQGAKIGATSGMLSPIVGADGALDYAGEAAKNAAIGGASGGILTGGFEGAKKVGRGILNVTDEFTQAGRQRAVGRLGNAVAGQNQPQVLAALESSADNVPGSTLTAGQASVPANSAEFAALQRIAAEASPSKYAGVLGVEGQQEGARRGLLQTIGKTPALLDAAEAARSAAANQNYGAAYAQQIKADPQLAQMSQNPFFKDALGSALKLAEAQKINPKTELTEFLQLVKFSLDKKLSQATGDTVLGDAERKAVTALKGELVDWMGRKNPLYDMARNEFAAASKPINQMQVGQKLEGALTTPVSAGERPTVFANAVLNAPKTIKASLGKAAPRFESLDEVLTPAQVKKVDLVMKDLVQNAEYENLASAGMKEAKRITKRQLDTIPQVGLLDRAMMVVNKITRTMEGYGGQRTMQELGNIMQNPKEMARVMRAATPAERKELVTAILGQIGPAVDIAEGQ